MKLVIVVMQCARIGEGLAGMVGGKGMKILAVSDTHGDRDILAAILKQQPNLDGYFMREIRNYLQTIRF